MKTGEGSRVSRGMLSASRGIAWMAVWATVAILLIWLAVPVAKSVREWDTWVEKIGTVLYLAFPALCLFLAMVIFHFLPLYGAVVFLWCGVRKALQTEEHRRFRLLLCAAGVLLSVGVVVWYAREAVLLEIREFFIWGRLPS